MGIGILISKQMIQQSNGHLSITSSVQAGTTLSFTY